MKFPKWIPILILACGVQSFSAAQAALTCSNSPNDSVHIDDNQEFVTIKTPQEKRILTVLGTDSVEVDADTGFFGPHYTEKWQTYFVFEEDESIKLIIDDYLTTKKVAVYITSYDENGNKKGLHTYKSCTRTK